MNQYVFMVFLVVSALVTAYIGMVIPETKNKTFNEISMMFSARNGIKDVEGKNDEMEMKPLT